MSHIVSQNHADLTIAIVDDYIGQIPERTRRQARDYLYEDRCIRTMSMPGRLIAELKGYHDSYIPYFELSHDSWQGACTCGRNNVCSHLAALLINFRDRPDTFVFPPYAIDQALGRPWSMVPHEVPGFRIVRLMPTPVPWWMQRRQAGQAKAGPAKLDSLEYLVHHPAMLADLHPSWLEESTIYEEIVQWKNRRLIRQAGFSFWLNLWAYNPYLPLENVFSVFHEDLENFSRVILSALWQASPVPFSSDRTWHRVHRLLSLLEPVRSVPILWLWNQFQALDPLHLSRTRALMNRDGLEPAIQYIEQHWPTDPDDQRVVRRALIDWLPVNKKLPYWVADCLESGSRQDLLELQRVLDPHSFENLETLFNRRWSPSAEP
ncbi:MAG: hypothetical protein M1294_03305 [Firmicutes bacterium]|uniref:SWIM-type domain-containing protein n=1 Tax=Sulfobacillus benefaciens TaxID=453960 RepID=A0A2T2XB73_9FIRM|nr:hypothetical protein [Bacillota bacterium]PSR31761.1 MAG: hypothetical protein C7B43_00620 [Sulfobacillus benefaciens]